MHSLNQAALGVYAARASGGLLDGVCHVQGEPFDVNAAIAGMIR